MLELPYVSGQRYFSSFLIVAGVTPESDF